jgi:hypothetical protein
MIDLIVYDNDFTAQGIVDIQSSVMWERRFYEAGYFEIHTPASENSNALLKQGAYIMRTDALESGVIVYTHASTDTDGSTDISAIGRFLSWLLHGHIVQSTTTYSGNAETIMRTLVENTVMNSETVDYIPDLALCGDNAAMIAAAGYYEYMSGKRADASLNASALDSI